MRTFLWVWTMITVVSCGASVRAADLVTLHPGNYGEFAPSGQEVDAIFGDYVLRNDKITAVIADPTVMMGRSASRKNVPFPLGVVIDLTRRDEPNDLLQSFAPQYYGSYWRDAPIIQGIAGEPMKATLFTNEADAWKQPGREPKTGKRVTLTLPYKKPGIEVRYTLADGWDYLQVEMVYDVATLKKSKKAYLPTAMLWMMSAEEVGNDGESLNWVYDSTGGQAYGVSTPGIVMRQSADRGQYISMDYRRDATFDLPDTKTFTILHRVFPARDVFQLRELVNAADGVAAKPFALTVRGPEGPVAQALITATVDDKTYAVGRTDATGKLSGALPPGEYAIAVKSYGRPEVTTTLQPGATEAQNVMLEATAGLRLVVTDGDGKAIPCKVEFRGVDDTRTPRLPSADDRVKNLAFSADGVVSQVLPAGRYRLLISHGPEYDFADRVVEIAPGQTTELAVTLARTVDTAGWLSVELGSVSTKSWNYSGLSVAGRVLNLAAEQVEFAPACEKDTVYDYSDTVRELKLSAHLATCPGIGLTERVRKTVTSQNSFPVRYIPGAQDGGAVQRPQHIAQVAWLHSWYGPHTTHGITGYTAGSEKLIQVTVPAYHENDGGWNGMWALFHDPCMIGSWASTGFEEVSINGRINELRLYEAMEIQPLETFLDLPDFDPADADGSADQAVWQQQMFEWRRDQTREVENANLYYLRMLNSGLRITGMVNTNSKGNYHGSGVYRTYVQLDQDDPATVDPLAVVRAIKAGRAVMTTGPFMTVTAKVRDGEGGLGDDLHAVDGKAILHVRIQAQRGTQIDRVRVLYNGRVVPALTRTRAKNADLFHDGTLQFEADIELQMTCDTRVMVIADGMGTELWDSTLQEAAAAEKPLGKRQHVVMSNPIYMDVEGDGFRPMPIWQDRVYSVISWSKPLLSAPDAEPAEFLLQLKNRGTEVAVDTFTINIQPEGVAEVVGDSTFSYTLAPGEEKAFRFQVRVLPAVGAKAAKRWLRVGVPRGTASTGRRPVAITMTVDNTKPVEPQRLIEYSSWLPEQIPEQPNDMMWQPYVEQK